MPVLVKICGMKDAGILEEALALDPPMDVVGFVFAESKRRVTPEQAAAMIASVRRKGLRLPKFAGVFVNPEADELRSVLKQVPLEIVQLHGQEPPGFCSWVRTEFNKNVVKVFPIARMLSEEELERMLDPYSGAIDALMLDTYDPRHGGGSGIPFRWEAIPPYRKWARRRGIPLFVAGGLNADNVGALIAQYEPDGVDVSSGVETDGVKDIHKIQTFVGRVKLS